MTRFAPGLIVVLVAVTPRFSDAVAQGSVAFEVASVRENTSTATSMSYRWDTSGLRVNNMPLHGLLVFAYGITNPDGLINKPGWVRTTRFDISANLSDARSRPDIERRTALQEPSCGWLQAHHAPYITGCGRLFIDEGERGSWTVDACGSGEV
jgi:hypothetical protein